MDRAVEVTHTADGITLLFDTFSGESRNLLESFKNAGAAFHAAVIEDDGFLPDDVMSVYGFFLGDYKGHKEIWHTGGTTGFISRASRFVDDDMSLIMLTNYEGLPKNVMYEKIAAQIFEI